MLANDLWWSVVPSLGLGAFLGILINRLLDLVQERRKQRYSLQAKLFDVKIETTLKAIRSMKYGSVVLRTVSKRLEELFGSVLKPSDVRGTTFVPELERYLKSLEKLAEESLGADALLNFFYGEKLGPYTQRQEAELTAARTMMLDMADEIQRVSLEIQKVKDLEGDDAKAQVMYVLQRFIGIQVRAKEVSRQADKVDSTSDELIAAIRADYRKYLA